MGNKVLITCTSPRGDMIVRSLHEYNADTLAMPALKIKILTNIQPQESYAHILITSRHALLPMICVGQETANIAQDKGFDVIHIGKGGVDDLDISPYDRILYPCALEPTKILAKVTPWPVYEATQNTDFTIPYDVSIITVFSAKAAKMIKSYDLTNKTILCLSDNIASIFVGHTLKKLEICQHPSYDDMKQLILHEIGTHT